MQVQIAKYRGPTLKSRSTPKNRAASKNRRKERPRNRGGHSTRMIGSSVGVAERRRTKGTSSIVQEVGDRQQAEEKLRESQERYRSLFNRMLDGVYLSTHEGRFVDVNPAFVKMFRYSSKQEILEIKDIKKELYFSPEERGSHVLDTGKEEVEAYRMRRKDGSEIWVEDHGRYIHDEQGRVIYHEGILRDITERRGAEEALRQSEEKYRMIFQNSPLGVFRSTFDGRLLEVNPALARMFAYDSPETMIHEIHNVAKQMYARPEDRGRIVAEQLDSTEVTHYVNHYRRKDGRAILANLFLKTVRGSAGQPICLEGIVEDITERKRAEEELHQSEERYRSLFDRMQDGIYLSTHEGRFVDVNPAFVKMFRYSSKQEMLEIKDIKKELYFSPEERGVHILDTGKEEVVVYRMRRKDGTEIWVEDHGRYVHDTMGRVTFHEGLLRDVTERKHLEEKLQAYTLNLEKSVEERTHKLAESERRFRDFADLLPQSAFEMDAKGHITFMNQAASTGTGYNGEDVGKGLSALQLIVHEEHDNFTKNAERVLSGEGLQPNEYTIRRKDGSTYPVMVESGPIVREGKTVGIRAVAWDITEEKRMENELRAAREQLEYTIRSNPAAIYSGRPLPDYSDWYLTYISERITSMLGFEPEQYLDLNFWKSHVHPDDRTSTQARMARILKDGIGSTDYRFLHRDGTYRWIREEAKVNYDATNKPVEVSGYLTDITELKSSEEATRETEARYRRLFESTPISLWEEDFSEVKHYLDDLRAKGIKDLRRHFTEHPEDLTKCGRMVKILDVNDATLRLYGAKSVEELRGELHRVLTHEFQSEFREEIVALWEGKRRFASEFDNLTLTGETKHVDLMLNVIPGYEHTLSKVLVSIIDLTDRNRMEQRLQQAERLAAVGETAAMVGHDLRNPLQGMASAIHLLKQASLTAKERDEMLSVIEKSLDYSDGIVRDLTDYSAQIQLELNDTTPKSIVEDALESLKTPNGLIVQDLTQDGPKLKADTGRLKRVVINLVANAFDAMPQGGTVTLTSRESDGSVEIAVTDTGPGIPDNVMANLWRPLQTTKAKGMGLGLAICKRIVDAHGGTISVKSRDHEGTTVTVRLPTAHSATRVK